MADILKVTTPVSGYENSTRTNPIHIDDPNIQNIVDPSKVIRPDGKAGYSEQKENSFGLHSDSNFDMFMQMLKESAHLSEWMSDLIFSKMGVMVTSGLNKNFAEEISRFMEMIQMSDEQLVHFMEGQSAGAVRFKGAFFNMLRQIIEGSTSVTLKADILEFLKRYNDMSSGKHILTNILSNLESISRSIPASYREPLQELMQKLSTTASNGNTAENAAILKEQIVPFLSNYVGRTYDMGKVRDLITLLTLNIARYENGNRESFLQVFQHLLGYSAIQEKLKGLDMNQLEQLLHFTDFEKATDQMSINNQFTSILEAGLKGAAGHEAKAVFQNIMDALLINESVYMPLLHMMIPAELNGGLLFSELWIDPNDGKEETAKGKQAKKIRVFVKFDIKDVGYFEVILTACDSNIDMQLFYPKELNCTEKEIKNGIYDIMEKNGLTFRSFLLEKCIKPKSISEVFPKIQERKNSINVRI